MSAPPARTPLRPVPPRPRPGTAWPARPWHHRAGGLGRAGRGGAGRGQQRTGETHCRKIARKKGSTSGLGLVGPAASVRSKARLRPVFTLSRAVSAYSRPRPGRPRPLAGPEPRPEPRPEQCRGRWAAALGGGPGNRRWAGRGARWFWAAAGPRAAPSDGSAAAPRARGLTGDWRNSAAAA